MDDRRFGARTGARRGLDDVAAARSFQRRLREASPTAGYARPALQYDESGYPIEARTSLADRVRRLITG